MKNREKERKLEFIESIGTQNHNLLRRKIYKIENEEGFLVLRYTPREVYKVDNIEKYEVWESLDIARKFANFVIDKLHEDAHESINKAMSSFFK